MRADIWNNASRCFREMRSPFDASELEKLNVTLDECGELSERIADSMDFFHWLQLNHPIVFIACMISKENKQADIYDLINHMKEVEDVRKIRHKLEKMTKKL